MDKNPKDPQDVANEPVDIDQDGDEGIVDTGILHEPKTKPSSDEDDKE